MRPTSHHGQVHAKRCGNCRYAAISHYHDDLLCFHGDVNVDINRVAPDWKGRVCIMLNGDDVGLMDGEEYSQVWGGRVVYDEDVCDEWRALMVVPENDDDCKGR